MSSSSYSILFIKKNTKQVYGKGSYLKMQHTNTPPQARVSERNPLDFIPNITHRNKNYFQYDYYRSYKANQTYS